MTEPAYLFRPVWDPLLRALHWWNALTLLFQIITGSIVLFFGGVIEGPLRQGLTNVHGFTGYMFGAGLLTRILWFFIGPPSARWRDLLPLTKTQRRVLIETLRYYAGGLRGDPPLYFAHNPFAGIVYGVFFLLASAQVVTGVITLNMPENLREGSLVFTWHGIGYYFFIFYVLAHVFAVFVHELVERHSLISAMVNGKKAFTQEEWQRLDERGS
jgi:Ni/Fe-hydrogenase 1 B-type cytochrome subunit